MIGRGVVWGEQDEGGARHSPKAFLGKPIPHLFAEHRPEDDVTAAPLIIGDGIASSLSSSGYDAVWRVRPETRAFDALWEHVQSGRSGLSFDGLAHVSAVAADRWSWTAPYEIDEIQYREDVWPGFAIVDRPGHEHARIDAVLTGEAAWLLNYTTHRLEAAQPADVGREAWDTAQLRSMAVAERKAAQRAASARTWAAASRAQVPTPTGPWSSRVGSEGPLEESAVYPMTTEHLVR